MKNTDSRVLDVRPVLEAGREPMGEILAAKAALNPGQTLCLIAPFQPLPLYTLFQSEGFRVREEQVSPSEWHIYFEPITGEQDDNTNVLDLHSPEPPAPLEKALEAAAKLGRGEVLVLHTRFRPGHLFEQLDMDAYDYDCEETAANHWTTHLWRLSR